MPASATGTASDGIPPEPGDAHGAGQDEAGVVKRLPQLRVGGETVEAARDWSGGDEVLWGEKGENAQEELVGQWGEAVAVGSGET